jgi:sugar phosphate isomerase/epimerase
MFVGAMNHPACDVIEEIAWMVSAELDFIDLTLEPPAAASWRVNAKEIRRALDDFGMEVVGHTAYYLPLASPIEELRRGVIEELKRCLDRFSVIGAKWMNLHPDRHVPMHDRSFVIERNIKTITELLPVSRDCGVGLMIENLPGDWNSVLQLSQLLDPLPELGLHLDIGHANLRVARNTTDEILRAYGARLRHVHLHDNKGGEADLHLPLGCGNINIHHQMQLLRSVGYDGTITLEVFSEDKHYLAYSRDVLRKVWEEVAPLAVPVSKTALAAPQSACCS